MDSIFFLIVGLVCAFGLTIFLLFFVFAVRNEKSSERNEVHDDEISRQVLFSRRLVVSILIGLPLIGFIFSFKFSVNNLYLYFWLAILSLIVLVFRTITVTIKFSDQLVKASIREPLFFGLFMFPVSAFGGLLLVLSRLQGHGRPFRMKGKPTVSKLSKSKDFSPWNACRINFHSEPDIDSRIALEAIWLDNASKEHISIPAFSKLSLQLIALGAPPDLMEKVFRAASQEINHATLCYSVASSLSGKPFSPDIMPEILRQSFDHGSLESLVLECFVDGCLMEALSVAHAREGALLAREPEIKKVLDVIASDEHFHSELSWEIVQFLLPRVSVSMTQILLSELKKIKSLPAPEFYSHEIIELIGRADRECMRCFGVLPQESTERLWSETVRTVELRFSSVCMVDQRSDKPSWLNQFHSTPRN